MFGSLSIRTRLTLLYSGLLFLSLILSGAAALRLLRARLTDRVHASLETRIQGVENFLRQVACTLDAEAAGHDPGLRAGCNLA